MKFLKMLPLLATVACGGVETPDLLSGNITSAFNKDTENWTVVGDSQNAAITPTYVATGGNPDGYLSAKDDLAGSSWFWFAPSNYTGDQGKHYQDFLSFDLKLDNETLLVDSRDDVLIKSGDTTLAWNLTTEPKMSWTRYSVKLDETAGWLSNGNPVTSDTIKNVLKNISSIQIRGEYRLGSDVGGLDNVVIGKKQ